MKKKQSFLMLLMLILFSSTLFAQVTTSSLTGKVMDANKSPLPGATIIVIHQPSKTQYATIANDEGYFNIQGMRVGGPYRIEISSMGSHSAIYNDIYLQLGETFTLNVSLKESTELINEVLVLGKGGSGHSGATNFKKENLEATPMIDRSVYDIVKMTPQAGLAKNGGISIAGSNNRYNSFQIDGMVSNDVFGLAGTGTNGGQTGSNAISLDAIEEIQIVVSPFDVRQSGFTGGGINAVTKSGTNKLKASVYTYYTDQNLYGTWNQDKEIEDKLVKESTKTYGITVGGSIIKDKLFFFASGEYKFDTYPSSYYPGYTTKYTSVAEANAILNQYKKYTGLTDNYDSRSIDTKSLSFLGRIDWNINKNNKLSVRYQLNDSYKDVYAAGNSSYFFANSGYRISNKTNSIVAELNSHINNSLFNEFRAGLTMVRDNREVSYNGPCVSISNTGGEYDVTKDSWSQGSTAVSIGTEYSSGANSLDQNIYIIEDNLSLYKGAHTFTIGTHNEIYDMTNLFIQAATGAYYYNNLNDFLKDSAYQFVYKYSDYDLTGTYKWHGIVKAGQIGLYGQDKWAVNDKLSLTYGLRVDIPVSFNSPTENPAFNSSSYATEYGVKVGEVPSTKLMFSPRAGFRWYADDENKTLIRGGLGLFTGRVPFVWLSNCWSNTGMEMKGVTYNAKNTKVPKLGTYGTDAIAAMKSASGTSANPDICTVSKDFKYPQVFRANLALEQILPYDVKITLDGLYSKTLNNVYFENLALKDAGLKVYGVAESVPASGVTFYSSNAGSYYSIVNLENTNKGYTYSLSAKVEKSFKFGLNLMGAYTFGHSYSVNDGTSSVAYSNWKYNYSRNSNDPNELSYSLFDVPHRIIAQVSYTSPKYAKMSTTIAINYYGSVGQRYCLTMNETADFNGDTQKGNSLLYIPTESELAQMTFDTDENRALYGDWIESDSYAKEHKGQYASRYSNSAPWENHFDLHIDQNVYYLKEKDSKIQITFDLINLGNLLNKEWGTYYTSDYNVSPLKVTKLNDSNGNKIPVYSWNNDDKLYKSSFYSRWHAQIGLRIIF
jgi:hypothetical protein